MAAKQLAEGIRKHGFRKWYERELLQGHAHLVLLVLCTLGVLGALEAGSRFTSWADRLTDGFAVLACSAAGVWALRRYLYLLTHAEAVAHQADCPGCGTYGRLRVVHASAQIVRVACRQCEQQWDIADP